MRVCHIISNLHVGGAETMLYRLLSNMDTSRCNSCVVSLIDKGPMGRRIEQLGVPVTAVGMRRQVGFAAFRRLAAAVGQAKPDLVQTWMYHADLLGSLATKATRIPAPLVWNIRHSSLREGVDQRTTFWTAKLCAAISRIAPARIIVNSEAGRQAHSQFGYAGQRMEVIPNGFDLKVFKPSDRRREELRTELGIPSEAPLVGIIGRFHPQKDHDTFIRAAERIAWNCPDVRFLMCGEGITWQNDKLRLAIEALGLQRRFLLVGPRPDTPAIHAALDVAASSSVCGEGFSNVLAESMACETPCVATDVGDAALIIGDTGRIVRPQDAGAMATATLELLQLPASVRQQLGRQARQRIASRFEIQRIVQRYITLWESVVDAKRTPTRRRAA